jgi:hypothetical protein
LLLITVNYGKTTNLGDVNGDNQTNKTDLAIVSSNFGYSAPIRSDHILYSVPRTASENGDEPRIWIGGVTSGAVTQFIPGTNHDVWPAVSPDGTKIAFTRQVDGSYALFVQPTSGGTPVRLTPTTGIYASFQYFAASWSPDGSKIAFIAAHSPLDIAGSVGLVDPTGNNFQIFHDSPGISADLFPPAWSDSHTLIFAYGSVMGRFDILSLTGQPFYSNIPSGSDLFVVRNGILFYRSSQNLAYADLSHPIPAFGTASIGGTNDYLRDTSGNPVTRAQNNPTLQPLDYFAVSPTGDAVIYTDQNATNYFTIWASQSCVFCAGTTWSEPDLHTVYNQLSNKLDDSTGDMIIGERDTADWEP